MKTFNSFLNEDSSVLSSALEEIKYVSTLRETLNDLGYKLVELYKQPLTETNYYYRVLVQPVNDSLISVLANSDGNGKLPRCTISWDSQNNIDYSDTRLEEFISAIQDAKKVCEILDNIDWSKVQIRCV